MSEIKNTIKLLRFPFALFLLPITLFSFYYIHPSLTYKLVLVLIVWHILVYPSSNGYNSYHDRDEGPIGGLEAPPQPTTMLLSICNIMDVAAFLLSFLVNIYFVFFVSVYIAGSRLYSNRRFRIKKYPVTSFILVFIFQGGWIFCANILALSSVHLFWNRPVLFSVIAASFFIGTIYPLTQIYQHEADKKDGVTTLSMLLGIRGTFIFTALMFFLASLCIYLSFSNALAINKFWLFNIVMLPSMLFFFSWGIRSFLDPSKSNFKNAMRMLILSAVSNNVYFLLLIKYFPFPGF
ncbi:MAG: hypothetical protein JWN78_3258 [Bacteroidota bacterium]|nr:hypothetical protein [Bacteroidota bacterium]